MLLTILVLIYLPGMYSQPQKLNITASIQIQNQTYFSYLPYISSCRYDDKNMIPGKLNIKQITQKIIFDRIVQLDVLVFWGAVNNGLDIALALDLQPIPYMGYILFDSVDQYFNRQVIFFDINSTGLIFYYSLVTVNPQTLNLTINIQNQTQIQLSQQAEQLLQRCNSDINQSNFAYIGNQSFLFVCGPLAQGFVFVPGSNESAVNMVSLNEIGFGSYQVASNPALLYNVNKVYNISWDCALLFTDKNRTNFYFINYQNQTITMTPFRNDTKTIKLFINRVWGEQARVQFIRLMDLYSSLIIQPGIFFPGNISSVFVSEYENIFVESITPEGITYLCVFDSSGDIYWNLTLNGTVIYYGNQILIVLQQQTNTLLKMQVSRPIYVINPSDLVRQPTPGNFYNFPISISCQSVNITIEYSIFWSTIEYPSAYIKRLENTSISSNDSVYAFRTQQRFLIIGPDFRTIPSPSEDIQVFVINFKDVVINSRAIAVFNAGAYSSQISGIIVVTNMQIVFVATNGDVITLLREPCGFTTITQASIPTFGQCILINSQGQVCICESDYTSCSKVDNNVNEIVSAQPGRKTYANSNNGDIFQQGNVLIKKIIYQLMDRNVVITIFQNNNVILFDFVSQTVLYNFTYQCSSSNLTNGIVFSREFFSPILILYCQGLQYLTQYIVQQASFTFQRIIHLYGFKTTNAFQGIQQTQAFVFIEVKPKTNNSQNQVNCCVLKLDLLQFTVSVIQEIIYAKYLLLTDSFDNYNFVITQRIQSSNQQTLIKIFVPNQWISFNQTNNSKLVRQYRGIPLYFSSPFYNFDAIQSIQVTFNLTNLDLNILSSDIRADVLLFKIEDLGKTGLSYYRYVLSYNMSNFVCGPVFNFFIKNTQQFQEDVSITQTDVLMPSKLIGDPQITFIQIINPYNWNQHNFTLNNLLLCISQKKMYVYAKYINKTQMILIYNFTLSEKSCSYYLYEILNQTAASLTSNCDGVDGKFQTPLLTINYKFQQNIFTHSQTYMQIPVALRSIQTIHVNSSLVYIVGVLEGPISSSTGKLVLCYQQNCSPFAISSNLQFLVDFSTFQGQYQTYFVFAIGISIIDIFINPTVQTNNTSIQPNYTISYNQSINESFCSAMVVLNATVDYSQVILSCSQYYYHISIQFKKSEILILHKFVRYSQCNLLDEFKPQYIYENQTLEIFFAQCRQNGYRTTLDAYLGVKRSNVIYTGYLQIFTKTGPKGPTCRDDSRSPIRIIPLSSSMDRPVFMIYKVASIFKFIYSQIDGVLIDNLVQPISSFSIAFTPDSINYSLPQINFIVYNQFHSASQLFQTTKNNQLVYNKLQKGIIFAFYVFANLITIIFGILYIYDRYKKPARQLSEDTRGSNIKYYESNHQNILQSQKFSIPRNRMSLVSHMTLKSQPQQVQMHFIKSRQLINEAL